MGSEWDDSFPQVLAWTEWAAGVTNSEGVKPNKGLFADYGDAALRPFQRGLPGSFCTGGEAIKLGRKQCSMARGKKHTAEQIVNLLRQVR